MRKEIVECSLIALFILVSTTASCQIADKKEILSDAGVNIKLIRTMDFRGLGDLEFMWGLENSTGDFQTVGCECNDVNFFITGGNNGSTPNKVYIFDFDGNYVDSFDQPGTTDWGWIDLAWDGEYFYGGTDNSYSIDVFTEVGTVVDSIPAPVKWPSGLAYDPATDHLWVTDRWNNNNLFEIDMEGNIITTYTNTKIIYGLAWDDVSVGGPYLWCSVFVDPNPQCTFHQFDPGTGAYTGVSFVAVSPGGVSNKACGLGFTTAWNTNAGILFGIQQCDTPVPGDQLGAYFISEISPAVPNLDCDGSLSWDKVKTNSTVTGDVQVGNVGEIGSLLNWKIDSYPTWGTWTFTPQSGTGLPDGIWVTVNVSVVAPLEKKKTFTGTINIVNSDDPTDFCEIDVSLITPRARTINGFNLLHWILQKYPNVFPILRHILA